MHDLLRRQLRRHLSEGTVLSEEVTQLLASVSEAYSRAEDERRSLERSLELTSAELMQRNRELRADVEARSRAERALRDRDVQTRAILAALPDLLLVSSPDGEVREIHCVAPCFLPEPVAQLRGRPLAEILPAEVYGALVPAVTEAVATGQAQHLEFSVFDDGDQRRYEARLTVSTAGDIVAVIRDQTDRMQMTERLRVADRMASVGTLAAGVAHELNNPLAYVLSNLELLRKRLRSGDGHAPSEPAVLVDEALDGARRMRTIIQDLRTFSQPHTDTAVAVDPRAVMDSALKIAATEVRHRAGLRRDYGAVPAVLADPSKLAQVFLNLVVNAVQALPVGEASEHEISVRTRTDLDGHAVVEVSDTGPGIPAALVGRIFEPFVTSKPRDVGTGLGLSICHNLVTSFGGQITVHPREPHGTTFRVRLPASRRPIIHNRATTSQLPAITDRPPSGMRAVLIIDDDHLVASSLRRLLSDRRVVIAGSGREGLERIRSGEDFEVVLCDLMMPELSGMDVYEAVLEERPAVASRFVFMTGGAFTQRALAFLDAVPNLTLEKPFDAKTLRQLVAGPGPAGSEPH